MRRMQCLALISFLVLVSPAYAAIIVQQNVTFNISATNTTYIVGANFTVDNIVVTQTLLNISNSSGNFIISAIAQSPINITILEFDSIHKKFTVSNTSGNTVSFTIGNLPTSTQIEIKKGGSSWTTIASNSSGYAAFTYAGYSDMQFELLQYSAPSTNPVNNNVGCSGCGGSFYLTQNKTNQTAMNTTATATVTANTTNTTILLQEPEMKQVAEEKINEVDQRIKPEDVIAREKLSEAEAAYSGGQYDKAYSLAVEAEGLIGRGAEAQGVGEIEKKPAVPYYAIALVVLVVIGVYLYKWMQKRGLQKPEGAKEPVRPKDQKPPLKERVVSKPTKQAPKSKNKDADLNNIEKRLEEIRKKIGK